MSMSESQIADTWLLFKDFIDKKSIDVAAERFVELLADYGVNDRVLENTLGHDEHLDTAINYYLDQPDEEEDYEDEDY